MPYARAVAVAPVGAPRARDVGGYGMASLYARTDDVVTGHLRGGNAVDWDHVYRW